MKRMKAVLPLYQQIIFVSTIAVAVMLLLFTLNKLGDSARVGSGGGGSFGGAGAGGSGDDTDDTVVLSKVKKPVMESELTAYLQKNAGAALRDKGPVFYRLGEKYDIDPSFAVALSQHETRLGKDTCNGIGRECNNFFCIMYNSAKPDGILNGMCQGNDYQWASFADTDTGIEGFYMYIKRMYVDKGRDTIAEIGCAPGSGYSSYCYCATATTPYCLDWISVTSGIPKIVQNVRNYGTDDGTRTA